MLLRGQPWLPLLIGSLMMSGCLEQRTAPKAPPVVITPTTTPRPVVNSILAHLDADGIMLSYSDRSILRDYLIQRLTAYRSFLNYTPSLSSENGRKVKEELADLSGRFTDEILEGFEGEGGSIKSDDGFYVRKKFFAIQNTCPVLQPFASLEASDITGPSLVPADTDLLIFQELDPERLVELCTSLVNRLEIPGVNLSKDRIKTQIDEKFGGQYDVSELGTQFGVVLRIGHDTMSFPGSEVSFSKPQLALIFYPPNDRLAGRVVAGAANSPDVTRSELNGFTLLNQKIKDFLLPIDNLTFAIAKGLVIVSSDDQLARDIIHTKSGKTTALGSSPEFVRLSKNMPIKANSYFYTSQPFQDFVRQTATRLETSMTQETPIAKRAALVTANLFVTGIGKAINGFGVSARVQGGYYTVTHARTSDYVDLMAIALSSTTAINSYLSELLLEQK
jgi:hypothetical protein